MLEKIFGNYMLEKFLEIICCKSFWKLYAGNLLMDTMCWEFGWMPVAF